MASKEVPSSQPLPPSEKEDSFWDDPKFGGPQTQTAVAECSNGFIRRYFLSDEIYHAMDMPEGRKNFLKYFDVDVSTDLVRNEESGPGGHLRFYYCDFLDNKQHRAVTQRLKDVWKEKEKDTNKLLKWDMLKEMLESKVEVQLELLNEAREQLDMLDGDRSELTNQMGLMEEELSSSNDKISKLAQAVENSVAREAELKTEIDFLKEELGLIQQENKDREAEKERQKKTMQRNAEALDFEKTLNQATRIRVQAIENSLDVRWDLMKSWKQHALESISEDRSHASVNQNESLKGSLEIKAAVAAHEILYLLNQDLELKLVKRAIDGEGMGLKDDEIQGFFRTTVEMVSNVMQTSSVYISEAMESKSGITNEAGKRFLFTAMTDSNKFLMGDSIPTSAMTHQHFLMAKHPCREVLKVKAEKWDQLHFYKKQDSNAKPKAGTLVYAAVPFFDIDAEIRGYIAADILGMPDGTTPDLSPDWKIKFMEDVAKLLGKAISMFKGHYTDYEANEGPTFFAKRTIEVVAAKTEYEGGLSQEEPLGDFAGEFSFLSKLAVRSGNIFADYPIDLPRKTYFGVHSEMELTLAKLDDLKVIREHLQDRIWGDTDSKVQTKLLISSSGTPSDDTVKLWRTVLVILGVHNENVLQPEPKYAWREIASIINENDHSKASRDKISNVVHDFDPVDPKNLKNRSIDQRFTLAAGLSKTIKDTVLIREGVVQMLLLTWISVCIWSHALAKKGSGVQSALEHLEENNT